jgi:hypothetical protein
MSTVPPCEELEKICLTPFDDYARGILASARDIVKQPAALTRLVPTVTLDL